MKITNIRHAWTESKGFDLARPNGANEYILLHFWHPMHILCDEGLVSAKPYSLIVYDRHFPQHFYNNEQDITHDWIHIDEGAQSLLLKYNLKPNHIYYPENSGFITDIVREMETEFFSQSLYFEDLIDLKLCELFAKISRHIYRKQSIGNIDARTTQKLKELRQAIFSSLGNNIGVPEMARLANMSESRFYVLYKALFGVTPARDLIFARVQRAKFLLAQKEYSVAEVARLTGYSNEYHFIRQFKQITGTTPGKYKP